MKRILFVGQSYIVAESRKKLAYLIEHYGMDISLIIPSTWEHASLGRYAFHPENCDTHIAIYPIALRNTGRPFAFSYAWTSLVKAFRQARPEVVHVDQEPGSLALFQAGLLARIARSKLIAFTWENLFYRQPGIRNYLERLELSWLDHLLVGSSAAARVFRDKGYRGPMTVLPNVGVDVDHFTPRMSADLRTRLRLRDKFTIGFAGRLVPEKGCLDLLQAFAQLDSSCALLFLGDGALRGELTQRTHELGIDQRVIFHPTVPHDQVETYLNAMNCLVLPSRTIPNGWREQFGLVLAQAMSCGVPVIGSDSGAIPEVIGDAGLIFPEGDIRALCKCIQSLQRDATLSARLMMQGRARVLANYSHAQIAERTVAVYKSLSPH